jgi:hypothetical protein
LHIVPFARLQTAGFFSIFAVKTDILLGLRKHNGDHSSKMGNTLSLISTPFDGVWLPPL